MIDKIEIGKTYVINGSFEVLVQCIGERKVFFKHLDTGNETVIHIENFKDSATIKKPTKRFWWRVDEDGIRTVHPYSDDCYLLNDIEESYECDDMFSKMKKIETAYIDAEV